MVSHEKRSFLINGTKVRARMVTGLVRSPNEFTSFDLLIPKTFYTFWYNRKIIGKALLNYYDEEMDEGTVTMEMFELIEKIRNRGLGSKIADEIENYARLQGFVKIFASDTKSTTFWKKRGYDIDLDEGVKYLTD